MIGSALFYLGALLTLGGLATLVLRRRRPERSVHRRATRLRIVATGSGIALITAMFILPAHEVVVAHPRERLDWMMPRYQFRERHAITIAASPEQVDRAVRGVTADEIRFYRTLTWVRRFGRRGPRSMIDAPRDVPILAVATSTGFRTLVDEPGREIVLGVAGPVSASAKAAAHDEERRGIRRPFIAAADGYASITLNFRVADDGRGGAVLSTETRAFAPDASTRLRLGAYWRVIYPGSALIRREWLAAIRRRAETR